MLKVYVVTHVDTPAIDMPYCTVVRTDGVDKNRGPNVMSHDTGDNIAHKNRYFGELSALYWIWKNTKDAHVGLCHYRRYFSPLLFAGNLKKGVTMNVALARTLLSHDAQGLLFETELNFCDIIHPIKIQPNISAAQWYCSTHRREDWEHMIKALWFVYPQEAAAAERFLTSVQPLHFWCLFISRREVLNAYCEWIFPLMFYAETLITPSEDDYFCRVYAFLAEHLFNLTKPDGTPRKLMSAAKIRGLGWRPSIALRDGIARVYSWFLDNYAAQQ